MFSKLGRPPVRQRGPQRVVRRSFVAADEDIATLLADARAGCPKSLGKVFEAMRGKLLMLADRELPEALRPKIGPSDLVQETAIDMQHNFAHFRGTTAEECLAWLRTILRNNVVDAVRHYEVARKRATTREIRLADRPSGNERESMPSCGRLPDWSAIRREDMAAVSRALATLPPDQRDVIEMRYWQGLTFVMIGARLNRSGDAVRKTWYRAIANLEAALAADHVASLRRSPADR